jgi:DNA-binding cell septation regulator SpoVG
MTSSPLVQDWKEPARRMRHEICDRHFARHYERHSTREKINEKESAAHELDNAREPKWRKQLELIEHCDMLENARAWPSRAYPMLQRNLLYTGVTRGKRLVVLVGQRKAIAIGTKLILDEEYRDGVHKIAAPDFANSIRQVLDQRYRFVTHIAARFNSTGRPLIMPSVLINLGICRVAGGVIWHFSKSTADNEFIVFDVEILDPKNLGALLPIWISNLAPLQRGHLGLSLV